MTAPGIPNEFSTTVLADDVPATVGFYVEQFGFEVRVDIGWFVTLHHGERPYELCVLDLIGLHVNGAAELVDPGAFAERYPADQIDIVPGRRAERWIVVTVEEAYIHCSKHIPKLQPVPRTRDWGTDDPEKKGGDYFRVAAGRREATISARTPG